MGHHQSIRLIDPSSSRRAEITHRLSGQDYRIDPFASVAQLGSSWSSEGVVLIYNDDFARS